MRKARTVAFALAACAAASTCRGPLPGPADPGQRVYERTTGGLACADCHGEAPVPRENPDWKPAGHPLAGVATRERLWGGKFTGPDRLRDASLYCAARF